MTEPAYLPSVEEQLASVLQMFGHVLKVIGEPVEVKQDDLTTSLGDTHFIAIDYTEDSVVFSLKEK
jgi:hypothetical protein